MKTSICRTPFFDLKENTSPFVTVRSLARYWGVDVATVYRAVRKGSLPATRLPGGSLRIRREDALAHGRPAE